MTETKEDILDDIVRSSRLEEQDLPKLKQVRLKKTALKKFGDAERALEEVKEAEKRLKEIKGEHIK